ncbi:MAG: hypothetical protein JWM27_2939 [Gemmatimonadetes bacterium]|nr:hypothetical protein [Gemmatimonadota bacterium]
MSTKLKLSLDQLHVDSFEAQESSKDERGTVHALWSLGCDTMYDGTCHGYGTCGIYPCKQIP